MTCRAFNVSCDVMPIEISTAALSSYFLPNMHIPQLLVAFFSVAMPPLR